MATSQSQSPLIDLDCHQLLTMCGDLVNNAPMEALVNCFEKSLKEHIMKYVIKQVIKEQIQEIMGDSTSDWKRVSFIQKLSPLQAASTPIPSTSFQPPSTAATSPPQSKHIAVSTDVLLLHGFIRDETTNRGTTDFPTAIMDICRHFLSDCANLIHSNQLIVYEPSINRYGLVFAEDSPKEQRVRNYNKGRIKAQYNKRPSAAAIDANYRHQLVSPYKILSIHNESNAITFSDFVSEAGRLQATLKDTWVNVQSVTSNDPWDEPSSAETDESLTGIVQYFDAARNRLLHFGGRRKKRYHAHYDFAKLQKAGPPYKDTIYSIGADSFGALEEHMVYRRGKMALCNVGASRLAIIGGEGKIGEVERTVDWVEMFNLERDKAVVGHHMNYARVRCGCQYNAVDESLIVFGGKYQKYGLLAKEAVPVVETGRVMEIYDFHKNMWLDVPFRSKYLYEDYPCVWNVGKCIFVAQIMSVAEKKSKSAVICEWIDLRESTKNGQNVSEFRCLKPIQLASIKKGSLLIDTFQNSVF